MATEKNYFHDKVVLLLLSSNIFLSILSTILLLLKLGNSNPDYHIIQYRMHLGLNAYKNGTSTSLYAFIVFIWITLVIGSYLSYRTFGVKRDFSVAVLGLVLLLIILGFIVSYLLVRLT